MEVLSRRQSMGRSVARCEWYVANGSQIALLVNPAAETVRRFGPDEPAQLLRGTDPIDLTAVLPGFELTVNQLFEALRVE